MPDPEDEDDHLVVIDVIDDSIVTDTNTELAITTFELDTSRRTRVICERFDCDLQPRRNLRVKTAECLRSFPRDNDSVRHQQPSSETKLFHQLVKGNTRFLARFGRRADVFLILKRLHRTVEELRRHNDSAAPHPARRNLDGLALCSSDVVALLATELGERHGSHVISVLLVQDVRNVKPAQNRPHLSIRSQIESSLHHVTSQNNLSSCVSRALHR